MVICGRLELILQQVGLSVKPWPERLACIQACLRPVKAVPTLPFKRPRWRSIPDKKQPRVVRRHPRRNHGEALARCRCSKPSQDSRCLLNLGACILGPGSRSYGAPHLVWEDVGPHDPKGCPFSGTLSPVCYDKLMLACHDRLATLPRRAQTPLRHWPSLTAQNWYSKKPIPPRNLD